MQHWLPSRLTAVVVATAIIAMGPGLAGCLPVWADESERFIKPVNGPIIRHYEQPSGPYAPGHRGIDFDVPAGTAVVASNHGTVSFAGPVADAGRFVTIEHSNGLQTTYSYLSFALVTAGQVVRRGDRIAYSGSGHDGGLPLLHFGAKKNGSYIDPEPLLSDGDDISRYLSLAAMGQRDWDNGDHYADRSNYPPPGEVGHRDEMSAGSIGGVKAASGSYSQRPRRTSGSRFSQAREIKGSQPGRIRRSRAAAFKSAEQAGRWKIQTIQLEKSRRDAVRAGSQRNADKARKSDEQPWYRGAGRAISRIFGSGVGAIAAVGPLSVRAFRQVRMFSVRAFDRVAGAAAGLFQEMRLVLGSGLDGLGSGIQKLPRWVIPGPKIFPKKFGLGMAGGAVRQAGCFVKGGSALPDLPTSEQLDKGAKPPPPPNDNIVIAVAGIGSSSQEAPDGTIKSSASMYKMDWRAMGYKPGQVYHFSYKGIEENPGQGPYALHKAYKKEDTYGPIRESASNLDRFLHAVQRKNPGRKIDLVAHSQGGVVAANYITFFYDSANPKGPRLGRFVVIASPLMGTDGAQAYDRLSDTEMGRKMMKSASSLLESGFGLPPADSSAVRDLAEGSNSMKQLREAWDSEKVDTTSIAATFDPVVPSVHTRFPAARRYTSDVPNDKEMWKGSHGAVVTAPMTMGLAYNALAGRPYRCTAWRDAFADHGPGKWVSRAEDGVLAGMDGLAEVLSN